MQVSWTVFVSLMRLRNAHFFKRLKVFPDLVLFSLFLFYDLSSTPTFPSDYYIRFETHLSFPYDHYMQVFPSQEREKEMLRKGKDTKKKAPFDYFKGKINTLALK